MFTMRMLIIWLLVSLTCAAAPVEQPLPMDECQLAGHFPDPDRTRFVVKVGVSLFSAPTVMEIISWWGVAQGNPSRMTCLVDLRIGGVPVKIPYKAYADLGNPQIPTGVTLSEGEGEVHLNIRGGEGGTAYLARLVVSNGKLIRREVVLTEKPDAKPDVMTFN